jgi:hypothetical protein
MAGDLGETRIDQEAGAIFRRRAAEEGWPGFHTGTLTIELRIRVGRRDTGLVGALLPLETASQFFRSAYSARLGSTFSIRNALLVTSNLWLASRSASFSTRTLVTRKLTTNEVITNGDIVLRSCG